MSTRWQIICFLIFLVIPLAPSVASPIVYQYEIKIAGFKIGELTAQHTQENDSVQNYTLSSKVSFWFFYRVNVDYEYSSTFIHNQLIHSEIITNANERTYTSTTTWRGDHYEISAATYEYKKDTVLTTPIHFNVARLFFEEPKGIHYLFADNYGVMVPVENVKDKYYEVNVLGNKNKYYYPLGIFERASMDSPIKNYDIKLIE